MMDKVILPDVVRSSASLWQVLQKQGGLQPETYDKVLVSDLISELSLNSNKTLESQLDKVSSTDFMLALFSVLEPWVQMVSDVLSSFERNLVYSSNSEVLVEFDFGADLDGLDFDLKHLKKAIETYHDLLSSAQVVSSSDKELFDLCSELMKGLAESYGLEYERYRGGDVAVIEGVTYDSRNPPSSSAAKKWFGYRPDESGLDFNRWPFFDALPLPPWTVNDPLAKVLRPVEIAIISLTRHMAPYRKWDDLSAARQSAAEDLSLNTTQRAPIDSWSLKRVVAAQHDRMSRSLLQVLWLLYDLAPNDPKKRLALSEQLSKAVLKKMSVTEQPISGKSLEELLALPLWQFRHQLYSVWLVTVVEQAVPPRGVFRLRPVNGRLKFSFSTSVVAEICVDEAIYELVAELKTPAPEDVNLVGKSRVYSVQPDYVIRLQGNFEVKYVLEAKQYRRGSKSNFSRALRDYAMVHDQSLVAIANYGTMPGGMAEAVEKLFDSRDRELVSSVLERCESVGEVRPGGNGIKKISKHIAGIFPVVDIDTPPPKIVIDATGSMLRHFPGGGIGAGLSNLLSWSQDVAFVHEGELIPVRFANEREFIDALRKEIKQVHLDLRFAVRELDAEVVLVTDEAGAKEAAPYFHHFSAVVTLLDAGRTWELRLAEKAPESIIQALVDKGGQIGAPF